MSMFPSSVIAVICVVVVLADFGHTRFVEDTTKLSNVGTLEKQYHLQYFFKVNYFRAMQYCRYHGWQLASINSKEEDDKLKDEIRNSGMSHEDFWTSGADLAEEGSYVWMSTGKPFTYTNWGYGEPNNTKTYTESENCIEIVGATLKWNDARCSVRQYFICESHQEK